MEINYKFRVTIYDKTSVLDKHNRRVWRWKVALIVDVTTIKDANHYFLWGNKMAYCKAVIRMLKQKGGK